MNQHTLKEERILFPFAEKFISPDIMKEIEGHLAATKPHTAWEQEFWLSKK